MSDKLQQSEMLLISKDELQRLYRTIREYEELIEQYKQQQEHYIQLLVPTNAS
jgi:hypothetical protein